MNFVVTKVLVVFLVLFAFVFLVGIKETLPDLAMNTVSDLAPRQVMEPVELVFAGDVMLSRAVASKVKSNGNDPKFPFLYVAERLREADVTFVNLENPVSDKGVLSGSIYSFRADLGMIEGLNFAGIDVVSLANNHIWDYGRVALEDTVLQLKMNDIAPVGAGSDADSAGAAYMTTISSTTLAYIAYTDLYPPALVAGAAKPGVSGFELEAAASQIRRLLAGGADHVIVSLHWGDEYVHKASVFQRNTARSLIDAGASMVIGHHPHVVQEVESYNGGVIAYSLGNFIFDQNFSTSTMRGLVLSITVRGRDILKVEELPVVINADFQPVFVE